jgi:hypothetical protein
MVRQGRNLQEESVTLRALFFAEKLEGEHFRIVQGASEEPVPVSSVKGATLYHHLERARDYFLSLGELLNEPQREALAQKLTVRMDIDVDWSEANHFVLNGKKTYNTCKTVPKSGPVVERMGKVKPWGQEIWFFAPKLIHRNTLRPIGEHLKSGEFSQTVFEQLLAGDLTQMSQGLLTGSFDPALGAINIAFSLGLSQLIPKGMGWVLGKVKTRFYLDTAMIPEIIYHEYTHSVIRKSDLDLKRSTQLIEGLPNFFAYKISGLQNLAARDRGFGRGTRGKRAMAHGLYSFDQDLFQVAIYGSFTYSLLVQLEEALGPEGLMLILRTVDHIDFDSDLKHDFVAALFAAIEQHSRNPARQKWAANRVFLERGF